LKHPPLIPQGWMADIRQFINSIEAGAEYGRFPPVGPLLNASFAARDLLRGKRTAADRKAHQHASEPEPDSATPAFDRELAQREPAAIARFFVQHANRQQIIDRRRRNYQLWRMNSTVSPACP
jgi:hypothetical protein